MFLRKINIYNIRKLNNSRMLSLNLKNKEFINSDIIPISPSFQEFSNFKNSICMYQSIYLSI
jgi:hypothetical protein